MVRTGDNDDDNNSHLPAGVVAAVVVVEICTHECARIPYKLQSNETTEIVRHADPNAVIPFYRFVVPFRRPTFCIGSYEKAHASNSIVVCALFGFLMGIRNHMNSG